MVRAELESLATEIATPKMTDEDLAELERAERRFHRATRGARGDEPRGPPGPRGRARLAPPEPLVPRRDLPRGRGSADRADGEGRATDVPREAGLGDGRRPRRALREERPPAPRDPRGDRRAEPARARASSPASTSSRRAACSRRSWTRCRRSRASQRASESTMRRGCEAAALRDSRARFLARGLRLAEPARPDSPRGASGSRPSCAGERPREQLARDDRQQRRQEGRRRRRDREHVVGAEDRRRPRSRSRRSSRPLRAARSTASTTAGSVASSDAIAHTGKSESSAAIGPVREVRRGERLGRDAAGLQELQRDLSRGRELGSAADDEHAPGIRERKRDVRDPRLDRADERRHCLGDRAQPRRANAAPSPAVWAASRPSAATWFVYVFVAATACSGPARSSSTASASRRAPTRDRS